MKMHAAIAVFLVQFLFAAAREHSVHTYQDDVANSNIGNAEEVLDVQDVDSNISREVNFRKVCVPIPSCEKPKCGLKNKCVRIPYCKRKGWRVKCGMKSRCFHIPYCSKPSCSTNTKCRNIPVVNHCVKVPHCTKKCSTSTRCVRVPYCVKKGWKRRCSHTNRCFRAPICKRECSFRKKCTVRKAILKKMDFEEGFDEPAMDLDEAIKMIDTIPDKDINKQVHDEIKKGDIQAAEKLVHEFFDTFVSKLNDDEKAKISANKSKIIAALDVAVEHYNDDK